MIPALARFASAVAPRFYWRSADGRVELVASGESARIETSGERRFADAAEQAEALLARLARPSGDAPPEAGPLLVGGFGFWPERIAARREHDRRALSLDGPRVLNVIRHG